MATKEQVYQLQNKRIAALVSGDESKLNTDKTITLLLHGWLDNAASFTPIFEYLNSFNLVAIDLQGHGKSSHRPASSDYNLVDYVQDVYQLVSEQEWGQVNIVGHSLGGIVGAMFCACFPENVKRFVCIETAGPLTEPEQTTTKQLRESIISRVKAAKSNVMQPKSLEQVVASRIKVSDLNADNARTILQRNLEQTLGETELRWRTDHRLRTKSSIRLTEGQAMDIVENIKAETLLILGSKGFEKVRINYEKRKAHYPKLSMVEIDGGHHVHMESPRKVAEQIRLFLEQ